MVLIPSGSFQMGKEGSSRNEMPVHSVYLDAFFMDKTEVTNHQYAKCIQEGICKELYYAHSFSHENYFGSPEYDNYPVIHASWEHARDFCEWRGARLPTEAEWEKAARGGLEGQSFPWGDQDPDCSIANYLGKDGYCIGDTASVGSYPPNGYGLFDMSGNVWEWVSDCYKRDYYSQSPERNPPGPLCTNNRVLRGGSWTDSRIYLGVATRYWYQADHRGFGLNYIGFRCARDS